MCAKQSFSTSLASVLNRGLIFVSGKGGVGKTTVSRTVAQLLSQESGKTLWAAFEDTSMPLGELRELSKDLWLLNCEASRAFEEYAGLKIGIPGLTRIFLKNKLVDYLSKAAPGIHELVLLGKIWYERGNYRHIVVDMPSTGYGLAMFQSAANFSRLFRGGPLHKDAEAMLETFRNPHETGQIIVSLPEEMPLQESLELKDYLKVLFPTNPVSFLVNKRFPEVSANGLGPPDEWPSPVPLDSIDYIRKRSILESFNLRIWRDEGILFESLAYFESENLIHALCTDLKRIWNPQ